MRRFTKALLVSTAALLLTVGSVGLASTPDDGPQPSLRSLHAGDAGTYDVVYEGDWRHDGGAAGARDGPRFEVLDVADLRDADGRIVEALPVLWHSEGATLLPSAAAPAWFDIDVQYWSQDGTLVATQQQWDRIHDGVTMHDATLVYEAFHHCLMTGPGAGRVLAENCVLPGLHATLSKGTPIERQQATLAMLPVLHASADDGVKMDWWYAADLPVPVKFRVESTGPHGQPRIATFDLAGFLPGEGAMPRASAIAATPVQFAPIEMWGLSDDAVDHPFRLSKAFEAALTSRTFGDLREWLQQNPQGYVFQAAYKEDRSGRETLRSWDLHLSDGDDAFSLRISQSDGIQLLGLGGIRIERLEASDQARGAPPRGVVGDVPTIGSVLHRWERHVSVQERNAGANAWGFNIQTDAAGEPIIRIAAGRTTTLQWGPGGLALPALSTTGQEVSLLTMDGDGRTLRFDRHASGPAEHIAPASTSAPIEVAGYGATAWSMPSAGQAVGLGLLAAVLGGGYLVWPGIKAGGLALFSRLRPHELLEDPTRATIMDALTGEPGLHFRALCDRLDANPGRIRHHVHKLEQGGLIRARQSPGYTCYFPASTSRALLDAGPVLRSEGARHILAAIGRLPGASSKELAQAAGLAPATAAYHLKRLQEAGLVDAQRAGRSVRVHLTPDGSHAADAFGVA